MEFPEELVPYKELAKEYLAEGRIGEIEFSGATYQVQVIDFSTDKELWVFIQLDKKGKISDTFCSCEDEDEHGYCAHTAAAYAALYKGYDVPLHQRFSRSLWHFLCSIFAERTHYSSELLKRAEENHYLWHSPSRKLLFDMKGLTPEGVHLVEEFIEDRDEETEETSLKFSNLTPEEIELWRAGKPSKQLKFELSFWNDLAKWMMLQQESGKDYHIDFSHSPEGTPNWIHIQFKDLDLGFYLSRANLPQTIPFLLTVNSPYKVYGVGEDEIQRITYDQENGVLSIHSNVASEKEKSLEATSERGYDIGNWIFIPGDGFHAKEHHSLLGGQQLEGEDIAWAFEEHLKTLLHKVSGTSIYVDPLKVSYEIRFDKEWNLHIESYLFEPGDMHKPHSHMYRNWFYAEDDGFYHIEDMRFPDISTVIKREEIVGFIVQNRSWLNTQPGFHTFLASVETQIHYRVDEKGNLWFESGLQNVALAEGHHDFGNWIYVPEEGFYQKTARHLGLPVPMGSYLEPRDVAPTIRMYRDELAHIPGFFSAKNPVKSSGLHIGLTDDGRITHFLKHELHPGYEEASLRFYGDIVYSPGEGFHDLPLPSGFPKEYVTSKVIPKDGEEVFIHFDLPHIKEYADSLDPRLQEPRMKRLICDEIEPTENDGWYELKCSYQTDVGSVSASEIWKGIQEKKQFLYTKAGIIDLEEDRYRWLRLLNKQRVDLRKKTLSLSSLDILRLNAYDTLIPTDDKNADATRASLKEIMEFSTPDEPNIVELKSHLRPYQEGGVKWLWYLYRHHLSGMLCDDMGLGKTHQSMALMAAVRSSLPEQKHFLVVCPTSVIYHWQDKLHTFMPGIRICTFYGSNRSMEGFHQEYDLLLTSYGVWRREYKMLKEVEFELAIFDEIQLAKNRKSKLHKTLAQVNAKFRLGLTGTPIENHLDELKALFDVVLPGYMPGEEEYKNFFVKPIEKKMDRQRQALLSRFVKPFMLRRKKEDVLTDLPEKTEEISYCPLLPEQKKLYQGMLRESREEIMKQLSSDDAPIPYVHVFTLLSRLKQICDHPAVLHKEPENYKKHSSGKWELFVELLAEARESGQKVVVFSQYLAQLDIIETYLNENQIGYAGIRGSTRARDEELKRFRDDPKCEVFVASLQAAGLGIDLTSASVVIHYDRWWNAAREDQATDRVHRIGQSRGVQVFKLVTRGTFEEKIHAMIARKAQLMEDVVGVDDQQVVKQLDRKEILELLQDVHLGSEDQQDVIQDSE